LLISVFAFSQTSLLKPSLPIFAFKRVKILPVEPRYFCSAVGASGVLTQAKACCKTFEAINRTIARSAAYLLLSVLKKSKVLALFTLSLCSNKWSR